VCPFFYVSLGSCHLTVFGTSITNLNEPPRALAASTTAWVRSKEVLKIVGSRAYYVGGGKEANCLHMEVGGNFPSLGGDFTKIILMRATVVRPKSEENK